MAAEPTVQDATAVGTAGAEAAATAAASGATEQQVEAAVERAIAKANAARDSPFTEEQLTQLSAALIPGLISELEQRGAFEQTPANPAVPVESTPPAGTAPTEGTGAPVPPPPAPTGDEAPRTKSFADRFLKGGK